MTIKDLKDTLDLGHGYEGREYNCAYDNDGLGLAAVDWEERVDVKRMRAERLAKAKDAVKASGVDALFLFRTDDVRYISGYRSHEWPSIILGLVSALMVQHSPQIVERDRNVRVSLGILFVRVELQCDLQNLLIIGARFLNLVHFCAEFVQLVETRNGIG